MLVPLRVVSAAAEGGVCLSLLTSPQRGDSENKQFPQTARHTAELGHSRSTNPAIFGLNF